MAYLNLLRHLPIASHRPAPQLAKKPRPHQPYQPEIHPKTVISPSIGLICGCGPHLCGAQCSAFFLQIRKPQKWGSNKSKPAEDYSSAVLCRLQRRYSKRYLLAMPTTSPARPKKLLLWSPRFLPAVDRCVPCPALSFSHLYFL